MRKIVISLLCAIVSSLTVFAQKQDHTPQLKQLAGEMASFLVGTSDQTFESCEYVNSQMTLVINNQSKIGKYRLDNPFEENFYETLVSKIFSGNPQQGIQIMDFLVGTRTVFCFRMEVPGTGSFSEATVWPGNVKPILEQMLKK